MKIAAFGHVSAAQYAKDQTREDAMPVDTIPLPRRATAGSAGYDFICPAKVILQAGQDALIATGIRAEMDPGWVLLLFPRSGLGFKHGIRLCNTAGVIDSDYAFAENEGHILVKLHNPSDHPVILDRGERFCQGIFLPYGTAEETADFAERTGGFGSPGSH